MAPAEPQAREGFAGRWSRLKAEARAPEPTPVPVAAPEPTLAPRDGQLLDAQTPDADAPDEKAAPEKTELPPLESLTKDSDFSLFMRSDVADDARKQALRKLWTLDPHFATIDISECHSIDFNAVPTFPNGLLNTSYRVGSGMVEAVEEIERAEAAKAEAAAKESGAPSDSKPKDPPATA
jgi:hypothetical protein